MRTPGITGIYKKNYLYDNIFRFDYSHYILGYLDSEDGNFYDKDDKKIPFIRDVDFLNSKEIYGQHGFAALQSLPELYFNDQINNIEDYFKIFNTDLQSKMLIVSLLDYSTDKGRDTVLTEIDLDEIYKKSMNYYIDFVSKNGAFFYSNIHTENSYREIEDIIKFVKNGNYSLHELKELYEKYKDPYDDANKIATDCEIILDEYKRGVANLNTEGRRKDFSITEPFDINELIDLLDKRQVTIEELNALYLSFKAMSDDFEELIHVLENEIELAEKYLNENHDNTYENNDEYSQETEEDDLNNKEKVKYSLDDLKSLRNVVKEYLVGQDKPLKRFLSELSRMKDKNFEDNVGILLSGDSGVGKTFMVELVAEYLGVPFVRVDSTDLTVPGYVGKDLEGVLWELYEKSGRNKELAEHGIIFFDEIDKKGSNNKDDISGMGVLNHLLTLIDGADVTACRSTKSSGLQEFIKLNSKHMIIIAAGSFPDVYKAKERHIGFTEKEEIDIPNKTPNTNVFVEKAMMSSDFMNRLPIRIRLNSLTEKDFEENFNNGKDSPIKWEQMAFAKYGVKLTTPPDFIKKASELSLKEGSGFRGSKGIILTATSDALDEVKENIGKYEEIILSDKTLEDSTIYKPIVKKRR